MIAEQTKIVLISGISNAGKSSFADFLEVETNCTHVPLDKYFISVPSGTTFLEWVQHPQSIDWELLDAHLTSLIQGDDTYSPAFDPWGSGLRLSAGGADVHQRSRLMKSNAKFYVVPGCLAFEFPLKNYNVTRVFMDTPLVTIASRHTGEEVQTDDVNKVLTSRLTDKYHQILKYREQTEFVFEGDASNNLRLDYLDRLLKELALGWR